MPNPFFDPIGLQQDGYSDPIAQAPIGTGVMPMQDPTQMAETLNSPVSGLPAQQVIAPPSFAQRLAQLGMILAETEKTGSLAEGLNAYNDRVTQVQERAAQARMQRLAEYELMSRIADRHNTELLMHKKMAAADKLKEKYPELADLYDADPESAIKIIAEKSKGKVPFEGNAMDAQVANTLLTGDDASPEYLASYNIAKQRKIMPDGTIIEPDMSAYRVPKFNGAVPRETTSQYGDVGGVTVGTAKSQVPGFTVAEGAKPSVEDAKTMKNVVAAHDRLMQLLDEREALLGDSPPIAGSQEALLLDQNFGKIASEIKDLKQMGTYDTGVEQLARGIVGDPVNRGIEPFSPISSYNKMRSQQKGGKEFAKKSLESARQWVKQTRDSELKARGYIPELPPKKPPAHPKTKAEYDALDPGTEYIKNGKIWTKR